MTEVATVCVAVWVVLWIDDREHKLTTLGHVVHLSVQHQYTLQWCIDSVTLTLFDEVVREVNTTSTKR